MRRNAAVLVILMQLTGCATVAHRSGEPIDVRSDPAGTAAVIECRDGIRVAGETPARLVIPRKATGCVLSLANEGMQSRAIPLRRRISGKFWAEFWIGAPAALIAASTDGGLEEIGVVVVFGSVGVIALIGALVDAASGRLWAHEPDKVNVKLERTD